MAAKEASQLKITYDPSKKLGKGGFGEVYQGFYGTTPAAVKKLNSQYVHKESVPLVRQLEHENIVRFYGMVEQKEWSYLAMELCAGTLDNWVDGSYKGPSPGTKEEAMLQVARGLKYLHSKNIIHRDLKPPNILISLPTDDGSRALPKMKLADFGICKELDQTSAFVTGKMGTVGWAPPELLSDGKGLARQSTSVDIFSFGCVMGYVFTNGSHPFGDDPYRRLNNILEGRLEWKEEAMIADVSRRNLIRRMIDKERDKRPKVDEIINHLEQKKPAK